MTASPVLIGVLLAFRSSCERAIVLSETAVLGSNVFFAARALASLSTLETAVIETSLWLAVTVGGPREELLPARSWAEVLTLMMLSASEPLMFAVLLLCAPEVAVALNVCLALGHAAAPPAHMS